MDFNYNEYKVDVSSLSKYKASCIVSRILPDYPIAHFITGQFTDSGKVWKTKEIPLNN